MSRAPGRPVFIVGCPRSGTTWLYHLLLSSGGFAVYRSETQLYDRFGPAFGGFASPANRESFLHSWLQSEFFLRSGLDAEEFRRKAMSDVRTPGDLLRLLMDAICRDQGAARWAECTPAHGLYIRRIRQDFPNALFIHIVRDGRDVALSLARQGFIGTLPWHRGRPELAAAAYWAWIVRRIRAQAEFLDDDLLELRYEDLVAEQAASLERIARFIDKPVALERILESPIGAVSQPNSSFADRDGEASSEQTPGWQSRFEPELLGKVEAVFHDELQAFGYTPATGKATGPTALSAALTRQAYHARFGLGLTAKRLGLGTAGTDIARGSDTPADDQDFTLRPGQNIERIRELVRE